MAALWFKNLRLYRITHWPGTSPEALSEAMEEQRLKPCGKLEPSSQGWASPYGDPADERLVHAANGCMLLRFAMEDRVLPAAVVKQKVTERAVAYKERTGSKPNRRDAVNLRDEVMMELLPQAFIKPSHVTLYIDPQAGWVVIDSSSQSKADDISVLLKQTLPDLRLQIIDAPERLRSTMTRWLDSGPSTPDFVLGEECDLCDQAESRATVKARHVDLDSSEMREHLRAGKIVTRLGLVWKERLQFALGDDFSIARLKPEDVLAEQFDDLADVDAITRMDAEFVFMALEVRGLIEAVTATFEVIAE